MAKTIVNCDKIGETLYISFEPGKKATSIELNDHILLRIDKKDDDKFRSNLESELSLLGYREMVHSEEEFEDYKELFPRENN